MKLPLLCLIVACCCFAQAQAQLVLSGRIRNAHSEKRLVVNVPFDAWYHSANSIEVNPNAQGQFSVTLPVNRPQTIFLDYNGKRIYLYAAPKQTLGLVFDSQSYPEQIMYKGSLKQENTFRQQLGLSRYQLGLHTWDDSLSSPENILTAIVQNQTIALSSLERKKQAFSPDFVHMTKADIQYFAVAKLWRLIFANGVLSWKSKSAYSRKEWQEALVRAHALYSISNNQAILSYFYQEMIAYYPRYVKINSTSKEASYKTVEDIFKMPFAEAVKEIKEKGERYWKYKALVYGLQETALEYALASFLNNGIKEGELVYQQEAYDDFVRRFPQSKHRPYLEQLMQQYWKSQAGINEAELELVQDTIQYRSLEEILLDHQGRVVYIDLWGSWCGPCREEFVHTKALKERFKGKKVDFLYIAFEHSASPEQTWQQTIRFYELSGKHILGNKALEKYFQELYATSGAMRFPPYLLIDQNGMIVTTHAARPSAQEVLYQQIEKLL